MRIGIDFDNTIVCYDGVFHRVALEQGLIPPSLPPSKGAVRDYLRTAGKEDAWTLLQGHVYGARMLEATVFPGVGDFLARAAERKHAVFIISHRTRRPYKGPPYDLHRSAREWLERNGFFDSCRSGLSPDAVFFDCTKHDKLRRIASMDCTHFIDDLPELLGDPEFPEGVVRLLFDPNSTHGPADDFRRAASWQELEKELLA